MKKLVIFRTDAGHSMREHIQGTVNAFDGRLCETAEVTRELATQDGAADPEPLAVIATSKVAGLLEEEVADRLGDVDVRTVDC